MPELAELFSFVWVTAATASTAPSGKASPETVAAVEQAVVSAQRHVRAAVKKRDSVQAAALKRSSNMSGSTGSGDQVDRAIAGATVRAVARVLREATKVLHRGVSDISSSSTTGAIPAPVPVVELWARGDVAARSSRSSTRDRSEELDDSLLDQSGISTAVNMLSSEIQTALSSLASMVTRLHQIESQADLASSRDKLDAAEAAANELVALRQEVQALRQESGNAEASYAAERDGHSAALQELSTLQNHVRRYVASKRQAEGMPVVVPVYPLLAFGFGVCWSLALRMLCSCGCCILYSPPL